MGLYPLPRKIFNFWARNSDFWCILGCYFYTPLKYLSFWATVCETVRHMLSDRCLPVCLSVMSLLSACQSVTLVYCGQTVVWMKMKLGMQVGLGPAHIALDGDPPPPPPKGHSPQFSVHICCGHMAAWIKMPLGTEVGLSPGDFVLDGDSAPSSQRGRSPQIFGPCLLWPNVRMDEDATWHEGRPHPRRLCVRWRPSPPPKKGRSPPSPIFGPFLL